MYRHRRADLRMKMVVYRSISRCVLILINLALCPFGVQGEELFSDEVLVESEEEQYDPLEVLERLQDLRQCPLDPNRASSAELERIPYLSPTQIAGILMARKTKKFDQLDDLLQVSAMDPQTLARARPFLNIRPRMGVRGHLRSRVSWTLPLSRGFREGHYWGDATRAYIRLHLSAGERLWAGVLAEKDPGEADLADYRSFFIQVTGSQPMQQLLLGDFSLEFGQGLALWTRGGASAGGRGVTDVKKVARGIRPYTSTDEDAGLRGIAVRGALGSLALDLFLSRVGLDASLDDDGAATSMCVGGLHRTAAEMEKKDVLEETLLGGHLGFRLAGDRELGLTWYRCRYRPPLKPSDRIRQRYSLRGADHQVLGADADVSFGSLNLFGELALSQGHGGALTAGVRLDYGSVRAAAQWRQYPADFQSPRGSALAAKDDRNENGALLALFWKINRRTQAEVTADGFKRPWRTYSLKMPSAGESWTFTFSHRLTGRIALCFRFKGKVDDVASVPSDEQQENPVRRRRGRRFQIDWQVCRGVELRSRLETSRAVCPGKGSVERGALLLVQGRLPLGAGICLKGSAALFRVPGYDSRIYVCEVGPAGMARNVVLYGRGARVFLLLDAGILDDVRASARFCTTRYDDRRSIGSGLDEIDHNVKRELLFQLDWKW